MATPEVLAQDVAFLQGRPNVPRLPAQGGWANGDAVYVGPNPPGDAVVTYYQRRRHVFGDLTMDVRDQSGKVLSVVPSSKRRGLNRVTWSMRMPAPKSPPAATSGVAIGPRLLPGSYTVTMTKDKSRFTTPLEILPDPRATHSAEDRRAQFDLARDVYEQFATMTTAVERLNAVRAALDKRAAEVPTGDALGKQLRAASSQVDDIRRKIVATKEGGMITGEERLREYLTNLYYDVVFYEGRPSDTQMRRAEALKRELADVVAAFDAWSAKELPAINQALEKKSLQPIEAPPAAAVAQPTAR